VNKIVFWTFLSKNCYTLFVTLVLWLSVRTSRPNYINQKIETFERFLVMQKKH